jgi:hypothetical protein
MSELIYYMNLYNESISPVARHLHQIIPPIQVPQLKSNRKQTPGELGVEDGVIGAVDDAEEEQGVVVSHSLTLYNLYEFMYCLKSFII